MKVEYPAFALIRTLLIPMAYSAPQRHLQPGSDADTGHLGLRVKQSQSPLHRRTGLPTQTDSRWSTSAGLQIRRVKQ